MGSRALNALATPMQVLVRIDRADLRPHLEQLAKDTAALPHPALEAAANQHGQFLAELARRRDVLRRQTVLVLHDPSPPGKAAPLLQRHADELAGLLSGCGITLTPLDGAQATALLARACDPEAPAVPTGQAAPGEIVHGAHP